MGKKNLKSKVSASSLITETNDKEQASDSPQPEVSDLDNASASDDLEGSESCAPVDEEDEIEECTDQSDYEEDSLSDASKPKLTKEHLEKYHEKIEKTGVVYMSRVPPRLKADNLRRLLSRFKIPIGKIYLAPEDPRAAKKRRISGGSRRKLYTEGWIEFMNKNKAKALVKMINNTSMDPKKHSYHHDDMWNLKYLPKFKWNHLTERIAYEKEARAHRLRTEIAHAKKINSDYAAKVEKAKMIESIEAKKRLRDGTSGDARPVKVLRHFNQRPAHTSDLSAKNVTLSKKGSTNHSNPKLDSVLDKIFG